MILLSKLTSFSFSENYLSFSLCAGTPVYRTDAFYLEASDILSLAVIILMFLNNVTKAIHFQTPNLNLNFVLKNDLITGCIKKFYFKDKEKINGLEKIVQMFIDAYEVRKSNIFDVMDILTDKEKIKEIIPDDFLDQKRIDKYFQVLKMINVKIEYEEEFEEIAPIIYGNNYKPFLFTLFHQANNEFNPDFFSKYQRTIIKIYKEKQKQGINEIIDEITKYHCHINFFCFQDKFEQFTNEMSINNKISLSSKLFKIITSLDFNDTRSLNHFTNALSYSLSSIDSITEHIFLSNFGNDYQSKIGFYLFHSALSNEECFQLILKIAKYCNKYRTGFNDWLNQDLDDHYYLDDQYDFDDFAEYDDKIDIKPDILKLDFIVELPPYETITSSFSEFIQMIHYDGKKETKKECIEKYQRMISLNNIQKSMIDKLTELYGQDAKIIIFIHYLYFYEYIDEKYRLKSLKSGSISKNIIEEEEEKEEEEDEEEEESVDVDISEDEKVEKEEEIDKDDENKDKNKNFQMLYNQNKKIEAKEIKSFYSLKYDKFYAFEDKIKLDIFNWIVFFRIGNLIESILSDETQIKIEKYLPTIKFLKELNINTFEFHIFISNLFSKNEYKQFEEIVQTFNNNQEQESNKTEFLKSIHIISKDFYDIIISKQRKINIFIETNEYKSFHIKFNPLYTIRDLKAKIENLYKIPSKYQSLYFSDKKLKDDMNINDCGIKSGSTIHLVGNSIEIFIEIKPNKLLPIKIYPNMLINALKDKIKKIYQIKTSKMQLFYEEKELENDKRIDFYTIKNGSTINLHFEKNPEFIDIFIQIQNHEQLELFLNKKATIDDIKEIIYKKLQIPKEFQVLSFNDKVLNNENNLQKSSLVDFSKINLTVVPIESEEIQVNYQSILGKKGTVTVDGKGKVESILVKICETENIEKNQYKLIYNNKPLNNSDIIKDCLIFEGSTLILTLADHI